MLENSTLQYRLDRYFGLRVYICIEMGEIYFNSKLLFITCIVVQIKDGIQCTGFSLYTIR